MSAPLPPYHEPSVFRESAGPIAFQNSAGRRPSQLSADLKLSQAETAPFPAHSPAPSFPPKRKPPTLRDPHKRVAPLSRRLPKQGRASAPSADPLPPGGRGFWRIRAHCCATRRMPLRVPTNARKPPKPPVPQKPATMITSKAAARLPSCSSALLPCHFATRHRHRTPFRRRCFRIRFSSRLIRQTLTSTSMRAARMTTARSPSCRPMEIPLS